MAKREIPGYSTPEIYPIYGPGKVYLPFNPEKVTLSDTGIWPKFNDEEYQEVQPDGGLLARRLPGVRSHRQEG